ncbi:hypothetical protein CNQ84_00630 [Pseudomonas abyssi]|uniref:Uncharacterized protein n=1 Tax=Pseudomonas abyssi TaxID=170540 RepID=A0A2A3MM74_9PSED|nr:hypothetical protein [Pseudomonas abyssi]PBK05919.1 hypothetical protein CNQ84_00630 [Pseudomonas abyssi]
MANRYIVEEHILPGVGSYNGDTHYVPVNEKCWRVVDARTGDRLDGIHETQKEADDRAAELNDRLG